MIIDKTEKDNIKLILLDLDGTLLLNENNIPEELDDVIHKLNKRGITLGIATGRYYGTMKLLFKDTYKEMLVVSGNGASIYNNGVNIYFKPFEENLYKKVLKDSLNINDDDVIIQPMTDDYMLVKKNDPLIDILEKFGMPVKEVDDFDKYTKGMIQMSLMSKTYQDHDYSKYYQDVTEECEFMPSGYGCLDIMPKGITKASGIKELTNILEIKLDQIMAMGDAMNDYEMLKTVGVPVAMKNGDPKIKEIAKYITDKPNTENGCLEFIKDYFGLED